MSAVPTAEAPARSWRRRPVVRWIALFLVLVGGLLLLGRPGGEDGAPFDPASTGPQGTRALVLLLEAMDARVETGVAVPGSEHDVAVVFADAVGDVDREALDRWIEAGGTLVVTAPFTDLHPFQPAGEAVSDVFDTTLDRGQCGIEALDDVGTVDTGGGVVFARRSGADGCFETLDGWFVAADDRGEGTLVAVGGAGAFVNDGIGQADNAVLAAALLAPEVGTSVAFLRPPVSAAEGDGELTLTDLVGDNVRQALLQLAIAFLLYAVWRARRLGRPVVEPQPVELAASDLVVAVGNLLHQADRRDQAAAVVAADLRRALATRLGLGPDADARHVAEVVADRTGVPRERVLAALEPQPLAGADDLVALARTSESIRQEVNHVRR